MADKGKGIGEMGNGQKRKIKKGFVFKNRKKKREMFILLIYLLQTCNVIIIKKEKKRKEKKRKEKHKCGESWCQKFNHIGLHLKNSPLLGFVPNWSIFCPPSVCCLYPKCLSRLDSTPTSPFSHHSPLFFFFFFLFLFF